MTGTDDSRVDLVRFSRDGDQFHYLWTARRTLAMLRPGASLVAVTIEGVAPDEGDKISAGLDVIDVAEYEGSIDIDAATRVTYMQLKHATRRVDVPWQVSGLKPTLAKFAIRYVELIARFGRDGVSRRFYFVFETNRPIAKVVSDNLAVIKAKKPGADETPLAKAIGLTGADLRGFVAQLSINARAADYLDQRRLLVTDMSAYLPDNDKDAPLQLKDLVTRKATSEFSTNPSITRYDVLHAIGASVTDLYPAPLLIDVPTQLVDREQLPDIVAAIVEQPGRVIIQADGGVGKSVLATRIGDQLPADSVTLVYDCFGNGSYRSLSGYRHRPRDAFTQIANEMAGMALCDPLIPTSKADGKAYARAFGARVGQASAALAERNGSALLCLVIDAADNAETAAAEAHDGPSFASLLLREPIPDNVRLVLTARTHRVTLLNAPPDTRRIELVPFSLAETAQNLRASFPDASARDIDEFHRLTSSNPRVQATALAGHADISSVLAGLGPEPLTVQDTIARLLEAAVAQIRDQAPKVEQDQLDWACAALATLRPFVPLTIVARTADVPVSLVNSLANDFGRALLVRDGAIQFRDEPAETWFRERFRPSAEKLDDFVLRLMPLAVSSDYVAAVLPHLMLEAGQFDNLVKLSLEGEALPVDDAVARRDVELQRLRFALQAALRAKNYEAAAKLSLKAGGETAAGVRQQQLISANTDLGAWFLGSERMQEQVSRRQIAGGGWTGSGHVYEAAFLSGAVSLAGDARSRLRIANGWLHHWSVFAPQKGQREERVEIPDIAEFAWAELNLHGAGRSADELRRWRPRDIAFKAGRILVARLVDAGRFDEVNALALAAGNDIGLLLAITLELATVARTPPLIAVRRATALVASRHLKLHDTDDSRGGLLLVSAVTALVIAAANARVASSRKLAAVIGRYLPAKPPRSLAGQYANLEGERASLMRAYALRAVLAGRPLSLSNLAAPEIRKGLADKYRHNGDAERLHESVGALLPWAKLWAAVMLGRVCATGLDQRLADTMAESEKAGGIWYRERSNIADELAAFWGEIILAGDVDDQRWVAFNAWRAKLRQPLFTPTLLSLARRAARLSGVGDVALTLAREAFDLSAREREDAEQKTETLILLARAVLPVSLAEARAYFEEAVTASGKIGSENLSRWQAMLHLGEAAAHDGADDPEIAYRFARAAELTYDFVARDKHFDWEYTVKTMADLSPTSGFAVLGRWLDRRFGREERVLPILVDRLVERGGLDARTALALLPVRGAWEADRLLEQALSAEVDPYHRAVVARHVLRYSRFSNDVRRLRRIDAVAKCAGIDLPEVADAVRRAESAEANRPSNREDAWTPPPKEATRDWEGIFAGLSVTSGADLLEAAARFRRGEPPFWPDEFYRQAIARVRAGDEVTFLAALCNSRSLNLLDMRELLNVLPAAWNQRLSVRPALQRLLRVVTSQDALRVSADRHYELLPWKVAEDATGLRKSEMMEEAIVAIAATTVPDDAEGLFRLAGLLSLQLNACQAKEALSYGLDLFEPLLETTDGDGPWSPQLQPPVSVEAALAGYVWAALGSPVARRRWEAAHVVRALCRLSREAALKGLVNYAETGISDVFVDADLRFYDKHALLWLMIALARAAEESGALVGTHAGGFVRRNARRDQPHVLLRGFAACAVMALHRQGLIKLTADEVGELETINITRLPPLTADQRLSRRGNFGGPYDETRFSFGLDIGSYWLAPLGRCFALEQRQMEGEAEKIIREDWGLADNGRWDRDERATRRYFEDGSRRHSHGTTPEVDDLQFYLSFHALMTVAGKLLETEPVVGDENECWSSFPTWLREHELSRRDGLWLADRRDPVPVDLFPTGPHSDRDWADSVNADEAFRLLTPASDAVVVWGDWIHYAGEHGQVVSVNCALASRDRSAALVRALTSANPDDFRLPHFEDSCEIDEPPYVFKGWVNVGTDERALDQFDPWSASINPRVLAPAEPFARLLTLTPDTGDRHWLGADGAVWLTSEVWSEDAEGEDDQRRSRGRRLIATPSCLDAMMRSTGLDLVIEISLTRTIARSHFAREKEQEVAGKVTQIILLRPGQAPWRIPVCAGTRRGTSRGTRFRSID